MVELRNIVIADIDGYHEDGWCAPLLRGRLIAPAGGNGITFKCWIKPDGEPHHETYLLRLQSLPPVHQSVLPGEIVELSVEMPLHAGQEVSFSLNCTSIVKADADQRRISFILSSISAV